MKWFRAVGAYGKVGLLAFLEFEDHYPEFLVINFTPDEARTLRDEIDVALRDISQ